jgi:hypothetical protein
MRFKIDRYALANAAQHSVHADPAPLRLAGQAGWILTAKLAFFVTLSFVRFVGKSRPSSRRYPLQGRCREPLVRQGKLGVSCKVKVLTEQGLTSHSYRVLQ